MTFKEQQQQFLEGVFWSSEYIALDRDQPTIAAELLREAGVTREVALKMATEAGSRVGQMKRFIRDELK